MDELAWTVLVCTYLGILGKFLRDHGGNFYWWVLGDSMMWVFGYWTVLGTIALIGAAYVG